VFAFVAAAVVFCVVQDRVTAAGVQEYVARQRQALAAPAREGTPLEGALRIDDVMRPARQRSLEQGALWGGVAGIVAFQCGALYRRVRRG
jgi:hypothetical protein